MKAFAPVILAVLGSIALVGCQSGGKNDQVKLVEDVTGGANPYLWRASLDTLQNLPLVSADPFGGTIIYDWKSYEAAPNERIKATVYILDSRLRADGVKVAVFRQTRNGSDWTDAGVDPDTGIQLENAILARARNLKAAEIN